MSKKVFAIGLDSVSPTQIEKLIEKGICPNIKALKNQSFNAKILNNDIYQSETPWVTFTTGCDPQKTGYWTPIVYDSKNYKVHEVATYEFDKYEPFYNLSEQFKVCVFDVPLTRITKDVNGCQVIGWGPESHQCLSHSQPKELLNELIDKYGAHPKYEESLIDLSDSSEGSGLKSFEVSSCYDLKGLLSFKEGLIEGIKRRFAICRDLIQRDEWDLFLSVVSETHFAGHMLWHLSESHPLNYLKIEGEDPLDEVYKVLDFEIGEFKKILPEDSQLVLFSVHGMMENTVDAPSMIMLPEYLYRWNFPNKKALDYDASVKTNQFKHAGHWKKEVWALVNESFSNELGSPIEQQENGDTLNWQPANWYQPLWHKMKAFALPSYSDGYIRINVKGRDAQGCVLPSEYEQVCEEVIECIKGLKDVVTNQSIVKDIIKTRVTPLDDNPKLPSADIVIKWVDDVVVNKVVNETYGNLGPLPCFRPGGHSNEGFFMCSNTHKSGNDFVKQGRIVDVTASMLDLLNLKVPREMDGQSLFH